MTNMTNEEAIAELKYSIEMTHFDPLTGETSEWLNKENQRYVDACNMAIKALEQESCEDEYIKVPKKALKYRAAEIVAYNVEWLKKHFDMERAIIFKELAENKVEEMEPTERQIEYAKYLAERMCQEMPKDFTKEAYSEFISKWKPAVLEEDKAMNEPDEWQMQYM